MFRCRIYQTEPNQAPKDYFQIWDEDEESTDGPKNSKLMLVLIDDTKGPMERAVKKYLEHLTLHYYALGKPC